VSADGQAWVLNGSIPSNAVDPDLSEAGAFAPATVPQVVRAASRVGAGDAPGPDDLPLSEEVRQRVPLAQARAAHKVAHASLNSAAAALLQAGQRARSARQRVVWLQRWGSAHVAPLAEVAACRRGCAHCCHIAVQITSTEASLIAAATGRPAATPGHVLVLDQLDLNDALTEQRWRTAERALVGTRLAHS
jgi:hypothetical protein